MGNLKIHLFGNQHIIIEYLLCQVGIAVRTEDNAENKPNETFVEFIFQGEETANKQLNVIMLNTDYGREEK